MTQGSIEQAGYETYEWDLDAEFAQIPQELRRDYEPLRKIIDAYDWSIEGKCFRVENSQVTGDSFDISGRPVIEISHVGVMNIAGVNRLVRTGVVKGVGEVAPSNDGRFIREQFRGAL